MPLPRRNLQAPDDFAPMDSLVWSVERYRWAELTEFTLMGRSFPEPVLVLDSEESRFYRPLEDEPLLFEEFANTPDSAEGVLSFANRYGVLGITKEFVQVGTKLKGEQKRVHRKGESLRDWIEEIRAASRVVAMWDALHGASPKKDLQQFIEWRGVDHVFFKLPDSIRSAYPSRRLDGETIASRKSGVRAHLLKQWTPGETIGPAKTFLAATVNRYLRANVSPQLLVERSGEMRPYMRVFSLLGAIWYQIFSAYTGGVKFRRCAVCNGWLTFERKTKTMHARCASRVRQDRFRKAKGKGYA